MIVRLHHPHTPISALRPSIPMSKPAAGTYVIVNRVLSPKGEKLAITFNGQGHAATVTARSDSAAQRVRITCYIFGAPAV